jgi:hypothetical protein
MNAKVGIQLVFNAKKFTQICVSSNHFEDSYRTMVDQRIYKLNSRVIHSVVWMECGANDECTMNMMVKYKLNVVMVK